MLILPLLISALLVFDPDGSLEKHAAVSAYAVDMETGEVLLDKSSDKSLTPASCMKVITTAAALNLLGPDMQFQTELDYDGVIDQEGILRGNLYIRGGGDPCLGSDRIAPALAWEQQLELWVAEVHKLGIKKILGRVIGDASRWEQALAAPSWSWEDLGNYYGAGACALSFHENAYRLFFRPGKKEGDQVAIVRTEPAMPELIFQNEMKTGPEGSGDRACIYGTEYSFGQFLRGTIPGGVEMFSIKGAIPDPAAFCAKSLKDALQAKKIAVKEYVLPFHSRGLTFYTTQSPPLKEIVHWTNQESLNLHAEHMLKKMGDGTTQGGTRAVTEFWRVQGVDLEGFNMADGSGLSRKNLVTSKQLVSVLLKMKKAAAFPVFLRSLPEKREHVRAKSGTMSLVKCYAGYAGNIAFAVLVNHCLDPKLHEKMEAFLSDLNERFQEPSLSHE